MRYNRGQERDEYPTRTGRKADWIGHIFCRNCLLKHVEGKTEEKMEVTGRRRRRRK